MQELTPKQKKNLQRLAKIVDKGNIGVFEHLIELEDRMEEEIPSIKDVISRVKGEKGDKGEKGEKGEKGTAGRNGLNGRDGKNALNGKDGKDGKNGKDGKDGKNGVDGKNATEIDVENLERNIEMKLPQFGSTFRDGLELLPRGSKLSQDAVENLPETIQDLRERIGYVGASKGGGGATGKIIAGSNISIENRGTDTVINSTASGSGGQVNTVVAGTGISVDSTDPVNPIVTSTITQYTDELAQDAVGGIVANSTFVSTAYNDTTPSITSSLSATGTPSASTFLRGDNTWATPAGSGDVSKVGTPVNNQVGVWTGDGTVEGDVDLTFDTTTDTLSTVNIAVSGTVDGRDVATDGTKLDGIESGAEVNTIDTVSDTSEIDLTITARALTASIVAGSIDETKLDASVNASLDLADSALQSLSGAVLTDQTVGQTIGNTTNRLTKLWATDVQVTNPISGSVTGNAATVTTNANLTGVVTSTGNATAIADSALSIAKTSGLQTALDGKQPLDADLTTIAGLTATTDNFIVSVASAWASRTPAQVRTTLGIGSAGLVATDLADLNEATIESAIDTLANLVSIQGRTVTLADAGADAIFGWDDSANAYENLTATEVRVAIGLATGDTPVFAGANLSSGTATLGTVVGAVDAGGATSVEIPNGAGGTTVNATGEVCIDSTSRTFNFYDGTIEAVVNPIMSKSITVESPTASEDISMFYTDDAITITKIVFVITGSTSVTTTIRHHTDRNNAGNEVVTGGTVVNSTTTGNVVTSFNDATVPADSFIWLETTALSGTPTSVNVTIFYRQDA